MKSTIMLNAAAAVLFAGLAVAEETTYHEESRTVKRSGSAAVAPEPVAPGSTYHKRTESHTQTGPAGEVRSESREETWTGTVKMVEPSRAVLDVNGTQYVLTGPMLDQIRTETNKQVTVYGRMDQPSRTITITRYNAVQ